MIVWIFFVLSIFISTVRSINHSSSRFDDDEIAQRILHQIHHQRIPLELTEKIIDDDAGSMSSTYYGVLQKNNGHRQSVVVKYSSFKSIWNYVHRSEINRLYDQPCRTHVDPRGNEYLVMRGDKNRIVTEGWIPAEVYVAFQSYFCPQLMPTAAIASPMYSYFSLFQSIEQHDDQRHFFVIYQRLNEGISLKKFLQEHQDRLTMQQTRYWIYQILLGIMKLKMMSIIHMDLNPGNIFLMQHASQHPILFIDFAIMKFFHPSETKELFYSETLHQSLNGLYRNCPSCQSATSSNDARSRPPFALPFENSFKSWTIEHLIQHPWFFSSSS